MRPPHRVAGRRATTDPAVRPLMEFQPTELPEVVLVKPKVHRDHRGFFAETWRADLFAAAGIPHRFVQDNHSKSGARVLRGLHAQLREPQGKLVRATEGAIFDVAVDIRPRSATFGRWVGAELSAESFHCLWVPPGFAHGFCVLGDGAQVQYKCTALYDAEDEIGIAWDDPALGIEWPIDRPELSEKDRRAPPLAELEGLLLEATGAAAEASEAAE